MIFSKKEFFILFFIFVTTFSNILNANNDNKLDVVAEVVAKEVFFKMRIKFHKDSLNIVKKELKSQKVPENFLQYFEFVLLKVD